MREFLTLLFAAAFLSFAPLSGAEDIPLVNARAVLLSGHYDQAIAMGENLGTADGLSLAAESICAKVMLGYVEDRKDEAKRARKLSEKALELDPASHPAHVQFALAYGYEAQASGSFAAWRKKMPQKTLAAITDLRETFPQDPRGDALLGAWHLGVVRKAGEDRALKMFEASEAQGILYYEAALARQPDDILFLSNYAAALLTIDAPRHRDKAEILLKRAASAPLGNIVEEEVRTRIKRFEAYRDDPETLTVLAGNLLDGIRE